MSTLDTERQVGKCWLQTNMNGHALGYSRFFQPFYLSLFAYLASAVQKSTEHHVPRLTGKCIKERIEIKQTFYLDRPLKPPYHRLNHIIQLSKKVTTTWRNYIYVAATNWDESWDSSVCLLSKHGSALSGWNQRILKDLTKIFATLDEIISWSWRTSLGTAFRLLPTIRWYQGKILVASTELV